MREIEKNLLELERCLSKLKKYYDFDGIDYKKMKDLRNLFNLSIVEDYYQQIIIKDTFNSNYIEYESKGDKDKILLIKEYIDIIRPYLTDTINDHKTQGEWKVHSGNTVVDYKT